jgi:hypothetical protein
VSRSVADLVAMQDREEILALTPGERMTLSLVLGERDLETFRNAHQPPLSRTEAMRMLERGRQAGRRPCRCVEELIG